MPKATTPLSKRQRANIEKFKREGPKVYAKSIRNAGLPKESWWTKKGDFREMAKAELGRMRQSLMGRCSVANMTNG